MANSQVSCILPAAIPATHGLDASDPTSIKPCQATGCINCKDNHTICKTCDFASNGYYIL